MQKTTSCFLIKGDQICLAMKKQGFGSGKWACVGGKVKEGESIKEATIRETKEEIDVKIDPANLKSAGSIKFYFDTKPDWNQHMHIYISTSWEGEPTESEEMAPHWHKINNLPTATMWVSDAHWMPYVLAGKKIEADFYYEQDGDKIDRFDIREI